MTQESRGSAGVSHDPDVSQLHVEKFQTKNHGSHYGRYLTPVWLAWRNPDRSCSACEESGVELYVFWPPFASHFLLALQEVLFLQVRSVTRDPGQSEYWLSLATHSDCLGRWLTVLRICLESYSGLESEGLVAGATGCQEWGYFFKKRPEDGRCGSQLSWYCLNHSTAILLKPAISTFVFCSG